jgi:hypothetical protein
MANNGYSITPIFNKGTVQFKTLYQTRTQIPGSIWY